MCFPQPRSTQWGWILIAAFRDPMQELSGSPFTPCYGDSAQGASLEPLPHIESAGSLRLDFSVARLVAEKAYSLCHPIWSDLWQQPRDGGRLSGLFFDSIQKAIKGRVIFDFSHLLRKPYLGSVLLSEKESCNGKRKANFLYLGINPTHWVWGASL